MKKQLLLSVLLTSGIAAFAAPVAPSYTSIGTINPPAGADWGGSGNPNGETAITTVNDNGNTITLGLQAQARYNNYLTSPVTTDGAGTYFAFTGQNNGGSSAFQGATWNFDFYFNATGGNYTYKLLYGTDSTTLHTINPAAVSDNHNTLPQGVGGQNSENLLFPDFGGVANTLIFNPNASGTYIFELQVLGTVAGVDGLQVLGTDVINVRVSSAPDATSTAMLMGLGIAGIAAFGYRKNRLALAK